jgi:copper(I)-binding protein
MKHLLACGAFAAAAFTTVSAPALAHVSFETPQTAPNSTYRAVLRVPHGCGKGQATLKIQVQIPKGVTDVKPEPKPDWTVDVTDGPPYAKIAADGERDTKGMTRIVWTGSLPSDQQGEFVFQVHITDAYQTGDTVYFPVLQECANGSETWTQLARFGQDPHSLKSPAPGVTIVAASATAPTVKTGALTIEQPWSRATPGGAKVGGGYVRITNTGSAPDRLIGGSFPLASRVEVHEMSLDGAIMRMKPVVGGLEIKPGATVEFKPGGYHLMFMDLREPLKEGQTIKGTLVFEKAGTVEVTYTVRSMGGQTAAPTEHKH